MLKPIFRIVGNFLVVIALIAGVSGFYQIAFRGEILLFVILMFQSMVYLLIGLRIREWSGNLNLISIRPEEIANFFEIPKAFGLGRNASPIVAFATGAAASAIIVLATGALGFITAGAWFKAVGLFAVYGGVLAIAKRRALQKGILQRQEHGYFGAHRRISVVAVPTIVVVWVVLSAPEANPVLIATIAGGLFFWIGQLYHHLWEVLHTAMLVLIYGEHNPQTIEWGLAEWLRYTRRDARVTEVKFDETVGRVTVRGQFDRPEELRSDLLRLDFVNRVNLIAH